MTILKTRRSRRDRILDLKAVAQSSNYHVEEMAHALGVTRRGLEHHLIRRDNTALKAWFAEIKVREGARLLEDGV